MLGEGDDNLAMTRLISQTLGMDADQLDSLGSSVVGGPGEIEERKGSGLVQDDGIELERPDVQSRGCIDKRYGRARQQVKGFRGDLGKRRASSFRGDLGKRARFSSFRGDLGKRPRLTSFRGDLGKRLRLISFRGDLGKRSGSGAESNELTESYD